MRNGTHGKAREEADERNCTEKSNEMFGWYEANRRVEDNQRNLQSKNWAETQKKETEWGDVSGEK